MHNCPATRRAEWIESIRFMYDTDALVELARHQDPYTRMAVAGHPCCPTAAFHVLVKDPYINVRLRLAERMSPPDVMETLSRDPDHRVRAAMAGNSAASPSIQTELTRDHDPRVRLAWASRYVYIPPSQEARASAMSRIPAQVREAMTELASDPDPRVRIAMSKRPDLPDDAMEILSQDPDHRVRYWMTRNVWATAAVLDRSAKDPDSRVRFVVAWHGACPPDARAVLEQDESGYVRRAAALELDQATYYNVAVCV